MHNGIDSLFCWFGLRSKGFVVNTENLKSNPNLKEKLIVISQKLKRKKTGKISGAEKEGGAR
jgi:hypothetical protein